VGAPLRKAQPGGDLFGAYRRYTDRVGREIPILRLRPVAARP
jgi:hypothetical protein